LFRFDCDASSPDEGVAFGDWQPVRTQAADNIATRHVFIILTGSKTVIETLFLHGRDVPQVRFHL
jgi:hypothetical protein